MGLLVQNYRLIGVRLTLAGVCQFDGHSRWQKLARLDHAPNVLFRRTWCMAEFHVQVFCCMLPSGKIYSWRTGRIAMAVQELSPGWHLLAAIHAGNSLKSSSIVSKSQSKADYSLPTLICRMSNRCISVSDQTIVSSVASSTYGFTVAR
jgi:hypothetical protein